MDELRQAFRPEVFWAMRGAVAFLYAIACLNASNLLLRHRLGRRRELSIRLALGGVRWRVVRLLALESVLLASASAAAGALVENWVFPLLLRATGNSSASGSWMAWTLNWRTLAVLGGLGLATSLLIPAARVWRADISVGGGAARGESPWLARLRGLLVVLQTAFAVILLAGAGLMIRTFQRLENVDLGFEPVGRAKVQISFPPGYHAGPESRLARLREIREELLRMPGVREAGFGNDVALSGNYGASHTVEGPEGRPVRAALLCFSDTYGAADGLRLKRGRWLDRPDGNEILVNEALARACWPDRDPVGQLLRTIGDPAAANAQWLGWEVVGVVQDVRSSLREAAWPCIYGPEGWGRRTSVCSCSTWRASATPALRVRSPDRGAPDPVDPRAARQPALGGADDGLGARGPRGAGARAGGGRVALGARVHGGPAQGRVRRAPGAGRDAAGSGLAGGAARGYCGDWVVRSLATKKRRVWPGSMAKGSGPMASA